MKHAVAKENFARTAILYPGNREVREYATSDNNRFSRLFGAFVAEGIHVEPAVYHDDFVDEVREQLMPGFPDANGWCRFPGRCAWCSPRGPSG